MIKWPLSSKIPQGTPLLLPALEGKCGISTEQKTRAKRVINPLRGSLQRTKQPTGAKGATGVTRGGSPKRSDPVENRPARPSHVSRTALCCVLYMPPRGKGAERASDRQRDSGFSRVRQVRIAGLAPAPACFPQFYVKRAGQQEHHETISNSSTSARGKTDATDQLRRAYRRQRG